MRLIPYQYYFANRSMHVTYSHAVLHVLAKHANKNKHGYQINLFSHFSHFFIILRKVINKYLLNVRLNMR